MGYAKKKNAPKAYGGSSHYSQSEYLERLAALKAVGMKPDEAALRASQARRTRLAENDDLKEDGSYDSRARDNNKGHTFKAATHALRMNFGEADIHKELAEKYEKVPQKKKKK